MDVKAAPSVTVDGQSLRVVDVETRLLNIVLPEDNILGAPAGTGLSVGHGWAVLLHPLPPGEHTIVIDGLGQGKPRITTKITVESGRS